jgi:hypothetical protein
MIQTFDCAFVVGGRNLGATCVLVVRFTDVVDDTAIVLDDTVVVLNVSVTHRGGLPSIDLVTIQ